MATVATTRPKTTGVRIGTEFHTVWKVLVAIFWIAILVGIIGGFFLNWNWTGFKANGNLWDWLQLLSAPVFVSVLPFVFTGRLHTTDSGTSQQQDQPDQKAANGQGQETDLKAYQDQIVELLLNKNLSGSQPGSDVRDVAKALTLAVLRRISTNGKGDALQFLYDAGLIYQARTIVDLHNADLSGAILSNARLNASELGGVDLSDAKLNGSDLRGADLSNARLNGTDLSGADLSNANLSGADLSNADLNGTNLKGATYTREQLSRAQLYSNQSIS